MSSVAHFRGRRRAARSDVLFIELDFVDETSRELAQRQFRHCARNLKRPLYHRQVGGRFRLGLVWSSE